MLRNKRILLILILALALFLIPSICNAAEEINVTRNIYSMDGSMKFTFEGLTIDMEHEYEYGLTKTVATAVKDWYLVTENTATSATVNIMTGTKEMREVINAVDTGYITIKDKTTDTVILEPHAVNMKLPYLRVTNYEVINNGQNIDGDYQINVPLRNAGNSEAYYKYEKITDQNLINKYKEVKANSGDYTTLESMLKSNAPTSGYSTWGYWNGHGSDGRNGFGYTTRIITAPGEGLYYLWVYFSGESIKNLYGCILVDNLQPDITVDSISLPATKTVEIGKTVTLYPTFNPSTATNKIVTWTSSDETVATVDNAGKVTPKKVGSTIITVITQDGNKKSTCTVTVTNSSSNNPGSDDTNNNNDNTQTPTTVTLSSIAITKTPTRNTYTEGEVFDKTGMVITATYSDGSTKEVTNYTVSPSEALEVVDTKVVVYYTENGVTKTVEQKVTVVPKTTSLTLTSIKITKAPTKTKYTEGEEFNKTGMVITATYSDGSTKEITNYTVSPSAKLKITNKSITVTYTENGVTKTAEQAISVVKDTTTKGDNKLPQTGATLLSLAVISLIAVAVISKVKYGKYKDI